MPRQRPLHAKITTDRILEAFDIVTLAKMPRQRPLHASLTTDRILEAVESEMSGTENPGFCLKCGADADGCKPDARNYQCEECGSRSVFGAAELLLMLLSTVDTR